MLEHAVYSVIPPEGCAAILWRDPEKKADAAEALNMTCPARAPGNLALVDDIIAEPLGGAHRDGAAPKWFTDAPSVPPCPSRPGSERYEKFRRMGRYLRESAWTRD